MECFSIFNFDSITTCTRPPKNRVNGVNKTAKIIQPSHQAPNQRGSKSFIVGVSDGEMYIFKLIDANV